MNDHRILNALSYFSILFAPIIVPVLIWIFAKSEEVSHHAKVALLTHIIPTIAGFLCFSSIFVTARQVAAYSQMYHYLLLVVCLYLH